MSTIEAHESAPQAAPQVFPLSFDHMADTFESFAGFNGDELDLIQKANFGLLPEIDPVRFLMEERFRPNVFDEVPAGFETSARQAYRAGICLGATIMRKRLQGLSEDGFDMEAAQFDPVALSAGVIQDQNGRLGRGRYKAPLGQWFAHNDAIYNFDGYISRADDDASLQGTLKAFWIGKMPFLKTSDILAGVDDYISIGLKDTFEVFGSMYGKSGQPSEKGHFFDKKEHFRRTEQKRHKMSGLVLTALKYELDVDDLQSEESTTGLLQKTHLESGFKGRTPYVQTGPDGAEKIVYRDMDISWGNIVPVGTSLSHIRRFMSGYVLSNPGKDNAIEPVGFKKTEEVIKLTEHDVLITRGKDGNLYSFHWPFWVSPKMADESTNKIELLSLCRLGESYPLTDMSDLTEDERIGSAQLTSLVLEAQRHNNIGRLGQIAIKHPGAVAVAAPLAAGGFAMAFNAYDSLWNIPVDLAAVAVIVGSTNWLKKRIATNVPNIEISKAERKYVQNFLTRLLRKHGTYDSKPEDSGSKTEDPEDK